MRNFILGTDWWTDCDDAVAIRILTRFAKEGKIRLLGIGINACMEYSYASLKGYLQAEGIHDLPIGIDLQANDFTGTPSFQYNLAKRYASNTKNTDAMDAVRLYRTLLAEAKEKIEIIEIGFLQVLSAVLESNGDDISAKSGIELVREKVSKIWIMAGKWDKDGELEHNFCNNHRSRIAAEKVCRLCPSPITFLGWEIGYDVITGGILEDNDVLRGILHDHGSFQGRSSWDPMLTLLALIGNEETAGYRTVCGYASVDPATGANHFTPLQGGPHKYVIKECPNTYYEQQINTIIG